MQLKQSRAGRTYIRLITKNHFIFPIIVVTGVAAIILLLNSVKINVMQTYKITIYSESTIITTGKIAASQKNVDIFLYADKNTAVYKISNAALSENDSDNITIIFEQSDPALTDFLKLHKGEQINADIAAGQISLLKQIFSR